MNLKLHAQILHNEEREKSNYHNAQYQKYIKQMFQAPFFVLLINNNNLVSD